MLRAAALSAGLLISGCDSHHSLELGEEDPSDREAQYTAKMIDAIKEISLKRAEGGELMRRFNQVKTLGCFDADFKIPPDLPARLSQGIFAAPGSYPAQLRFANATQQDDTEKDFRGLSIKVHNVEGEILWGDEGAQDFLLNSYPVLFAANPGDFFEFVVATREGRVWQYFTNPSHFYSLLVILKGRQKATNPLAMRYWSTTPYRFGENPRNAVKYSVRPCGDTASEVMVKAHPDFLSEVMQKQVQSEGACFDFMVQFQTDPHTMPIENASRLWSETESPFETVATIQINPGATTEDTRDNCETMTFNPWQSLSEHRPLGGINRTRLPIYSEIGQFRQQQNQQRKSP